MEETIQRDTHRNDIWALERDCVDGVFVDCDIGCGIFAPGEHNGPYSGERMEHDQRIIHTDLIHECGDLCEYSHFAFDDGNAQQRGCGGGDGCDVAGWSGSRTGLAAGWWRGDDVGDRQVHERRGGDIVVADILAELPDCGGWRGDTRCGQWRRNE